MLFGRMVKIDAAQRLVYARFDETPDRSGDVFDYTSSKPYYQAWSDDMRKASDGKSLGNVRAMHNLVSAGKVETMDFDDAGKGIDFCIKVVDDAEWQKCEEGVYTGVSPGGKFVKRWRDGRYTRYTGNPGELSLVDRPANPNATFTMIKADGAQEARGFAEPSESAEQGLVAEQLAQAESRRDYRAVLMSQPATMLKALFPDPDGEEMKKLVEAQDLRKRDYSADERDEMAEDGRAMEDGSYPIDDKTDLEDAIEAYGRAKDKDATKAHIVKRAKALDATDMLPADWDGSTKKMEKVDQAGDMKKGLYEVGELASAIAGVSYLATCAANEAMWEGDRSPLAARLAACVSELSDILVAMSIEETREAVAQLQASVAAISGATMEKAALIRDMAKAGARHSKADFDHVQAIHDHAAALGATCAEAGMQKAAGIADMAKIAGELSALREDMRTVTDDRDMLKRRVDELEAKPAGGGPRLRAIDRGDDVDRGAGDGGQERLKKIEAMPDGKEKTIALTRWSMEHPKPVRAGR